MRSTWLAAALTLALVFADGAGASPGPAMAVARGHSLRLTFALPAGYVERATLVVYVARATHAGLVVHGLNGQRRRVASQAGPIRRGRTLRLDVTAAVGNAPRMRLQLSSAGAAGVALAARPRLVTQAPPPVPVVLPLPAGEPDPVANPSADPGPPDPVVTPPPPVVDPPAPDATQRGVIDLLSDVTNADGHRYAAVDDRALPLDGLKIIESAPGSYVGVYHSLDAGVFRLKVATSRDLLNWHWRADLDRSAAQGAIAKAPDGSYVVAYEKAWPGEVGLRFRAYDSLDQLLAGVHAREFTAPRLLAPTAEGTPNIEQVELGPAAGGSRITVGFHYYRDASVDRQARGTLTDFSSWTAEAAPELDAMFAPFEVAGNIGDRDWFELNGHGYAVQEAQTTKDDWGSWRTYLVDRATAQAFPLDVRTAGASLAFGNPTATIVTAPSGAPALVVTQYVFSEAAAPAEAGSLIYFRALPKPSLPAS